MYDFHGDQGRYFDIVKGNAQKYVIPFIEKKAALGKGVRVLEIGCGSGGVLAALLERGCECVGVDLNERSLQAAAEKLGDWMAKGKLALVAKDIFLADPGELGRFDLVVMKDSIEHIPGQERLLGHIQGFLNPQGAVFIAFPPWQMPFGGHQQMCKSKVLSRAPWLHLLPMGAYKWLMDRHENGAADLIEIKELGISLERMEGMMGRTGYKVLARELWFINPIYSAKFGIRPRRLWGAIGMIPGVRNFCTTTAYYLIGQRSF